MQKAIEIMEIIEKYTVISNTGLLAYGVKGRMNAATNKVAQ